MNLENLDYSKHPSHIEISATDISNEGMPSEIDNSATDLHNVHTQTDSRYAKAQPSVKATYLFIVSGGAKREKDYFKYIDESLSHLLKIIFISDKQQGLTPRQMHIEVSEAISEECFIDINGNLTRWANGDLVYLISDVDQYETELEDLLKIQYSGYTWIISNPAFEIWLYYHYFQTPIHISEAEAIPVAQRSQWLKNKLHELRAAAGGIDPSNSIIKAPEAIKNSRLNYNEQHNGIPELYSTQMHIVAEKIIDILKDDFSKMISARQSAARRFTSPD